MPPSPVPPSRDLGSVTARVRPTCQRPTIITARARPAFRGPNLSGPPIAHPEARFCLPEIAMGLIPGAGGTVSITRRIGRHLTARLAFSGETIGVEMALAWGLVDEALNRPKDALPS